MVHNKTFSKVLYRFFIAEPIRDNMDHLPFDFPYSINVWHYTISHFYCIFSIATTSYIFNVCKSSVPFQSLGFCNHQAKFLHFHSDCQQILPDNRKDYPMNANLYFSTFLMKAFIGLKKICQRAANMPKTFLITLESLKNMLPVVKNMLLLTEFSREGPH